MRIRTIQLLFLIAALVPFSQADAHALGASFEATSTPYLIDVGYDPEVFETQRSARFDFELRDLESRDYVTYDHVWVRIIREKRTLLATGVRRQDIGPTTLLYLFGEPGTYMLEVSYRRIDGEEFASTSFPLTVVPGKDDFPTWWIVPSIIALFVGAGISMVLFRIKS